jgi:GNAT superfamily N-acetyltransferase
MSLAEKKLVAVPAELPIISADPRLLSDEELHPAHDFLVLTEKELSPDDPTTPFPQYIASLRNIPSFVEVYFWHVPLPDGRIGAVGDVGVLTTAENTHLAQFNIYVLPELRRHDIARRMLQEIVEVVEQKGRRLLMAHASSMVPSGSAFLERIGARVALESHTNQLRIADLNRELLAEWLSSAPDGFELGWWDGPYPEEEIENIVGLNELMNEVPHGDLELDDFHWTVAQLREEEASQAARGVERWTVYARDTATGKFAGYTQLFWAPHRPTHAGQGITGVWPEYRGKKIGRWIKAAMIERLLRERPEVTLVRTSNATTNAPMLKINTELGFVRYRDEFMYQVDVARVKEYLAGER